MQTFEFKDPDGNSTITIRFEGEVAFLHHTKSKTSGVGLNRETVLLRNDQYKRLPRGSDDPWSILANGTYQPLEKRLVPDEVGLAWVRSNKPNNEKPNRIKKVPKHYVDVDNVADYLNRTGKRRNFDS